MNKTHILLLRYQGSPKKKVRGEWPVVSSTENSRRPDENVPYIHFVSETLANSWQTQDYILVAHSWWLLVLTGNPVVLAWKCTIHVQYT